MLLNFIFSFFVYAGPIFDATQGACLISGTGERFVNYQAGTSLTCAQICAQNKCITNGQCVKGWTVWAGAFFSYGNECSSPDPSSGQNPMGKICCCTGTSCAQPIFVGTPFPY